MNTKTKSFTLSEMLIVLIITAIVVGLAFSVLSLVRKQIVILQTNAEETTKKELLENKLIVDFNRYSEIKIKEENLFQFKNEVDSVFYTIIDSYIIVNKDTLTNKLHHIDYYYKNALVKNGRIDALKVTLEPKKDVFKTLFIYKTNDATALNEINLNVF
ncbi:PulJ/GspJ family protein [Flavobacterium sp. HNIBRBA15423]|uniref:PulJ/GspJ family protein n=1 Tax=Flavobacterium sp. HNIBRBA15423 TaxID=3458683 RepID=UPI004044C5CD